MRKALIITALLAICPILIAQALSNDAIVKLAKAGLSDDLIVSTINASPGSYDASADGLIALKAAGVSDKVVSAIVLKNSPSAGNLMTIATPTPAPSTAAAGTNPDDPTAPHEAGIYVYGESAAPGSKMVMLEPNVYTSGKTGGIFASAMTYGIAKIKIKAVLRAPRANARISDPQPVFYFYFEQTGAGLSHASSVFGGTSTPNEYTLLRFDVKSDSRETIIGKANAFGASGGTDNDAVIGFTYTKLRPGVYKIVLSAPLKSGEYGFIGSGGTLPVGPYASTTNSRVFDFGKN